MTVPNARGLAKQALFYWAVFSASVVVFTLLATTLSAVGSSVGLAFYVSLWISAGLLLGCYLYRLDVGGLASHWLPYLSAVLLSGILRVTEALGPPNTRLPCGLAPVHYAVTIEGVPESMPSGELIRAIAREKDLIGLVRSQEIRVISRRSLLQPESIVDFAVSWAVPIPILSSLITGVALRAWEELIFPALAERYRITAVVRRTQESEGGEAPRQPTAVSATGEGATGLPILAEATLLLLSERGKRTGYRQSREDYATRSRVEVDLETGSLVVDGVRKGIRADLLHASRSELVSLVSTITHLRESSIEYQRLLAMEPLVSPKERAYRESMLTLTEERVSEELDRLTTLLDQVFE